MRSKAILIPSLLILLLLSCESKPYRQGEALYQHYCANCHMDDGSGLAGNIPPLARSDYLAQNQEHIACIIRYGQEGEITVNGRVYQNPMAGIPELTEFEITNIINFINQAWGNDNGYLPLSEVRKSLEDCK